MSRTNTEQAQAAGGADGSRSGGGPRPPALDVVAGPGGALGNTPPTNSYGYGPGGEDTLELAIGVTWREPEAFFARLDELQKQARETGRDTPWEHMGFTAYVQPYGKRGKEGAPSMAWMCEIAGMWFGLQRVPSPRGQTPNLYVRVGSFNLIEEGGAAWSWATVQRVIATLGGRIEWDKVSRVDLCVDLRGDVITPLAKAVWENKHICRARKQAFYRDGHDLVTGVDVGRGGDIMMRGYRKDIEGADKQLLMDAIVEKRFGLPEWNPEEGMGGKISRIEFQIRREALKQFKVDGMADYLDRRAEIAGYLVLKWFRLAEGEVDRTHTTLEALSELWERIVEAFGDAFGRAPQPASRVVRRCYDAKANASQAVGNGLAYLVAAGAYVADAEDLVRKVAMMVEDYVLRKPAAWLDKWERKARRAADRLPGIRGRPV